MAGTPRGSTRKSGLRSSIVASKADAGPSSGTTVQDESLYGQHLKASTSLGTQNSSALTDSSRFSTEPLSLRSASTVHRTPSTASDSVAENEEVDPLGECSRDLVSLMHELTLHGCSSPEIPLPKCVVIGDQSAGKSSVIEAISGVKVPRSGGTCTRCPMFIKMECSTDTDPVASWEATVTLRKMYNYIPNAKDRHAWDENFPEWQRREAFDEIDIPFRQTQDKEELGNIIQCAQLAILHPDSEPTSWYTKNGEKTTGLRLQTEFSPNLVCISITAPKLPNLSFYDLPGVIIPRPGSKDNLKKVIDSLVVEYIRDPYTLVLLAMSLETDWDTNSNAAAHLDTTQAGGRCIGVLTKPDRADTTSRFVDIKKALDGRADRLGYGYFVVKQPSETDLNTGMTHSQAREAEERFFNDESLPWASQLAMYRNRFGTRNLQAELSKLLAGLSTQAIPKIWDEINKKLTQVDAQLADIPQTPIHNVVGIVHNVLREFTDVLEKELRREEGCQRWRPTWDTLRKGFEKKLHGLRPTLNPEGLLDKSLFEDRVVDLCSDDEESQSHLNALPVTPLKRKLEASSFTTPTRNSSVAPTPGSHRRQKKTKLRADHRALSFGLDDTRERLLEGSYAKLAQHVNPKILEKLMLQSLQHWNEELNLFFDNLERNMLAQTQRTLHESFSKYITTQLFEESSKIVNKYLALHFGLQRTTMGPEILNSELGGVYLWNSRIFENHKVRFLQAYKLVRCRQRTNAYWSSVDPTLDAEQQEVSAKKEPHKTMLANNKDKELYETEIDVIAEVRAYYELARVRFHEAICMRVESNLFNEFSSNLMEHLSDDLGLNDENVHKRCVTLLAADPELEVRRQSLERERASLLVGRQCVLTYMEKYRDCAPVTTMTNGDDAE
ncbi:P-loop containing nucleoside triphosphate hydrolase protein [Pleomassaria siparia CBS 279.74]|uniref:P-loop containing nucleoside triphosphate hydrolase protein n=1 Tax=Pleomassaria siparia CBS 279.74 TaxID=1314801 RepID=A0A6G1KLM4_9PLEO|nr:P-loop containing nucleoside triphosphate hydrolase protein [Pleomassaria siparia CBS 279.74]